MSGPPDPLSTLRVGRVALRTRAQRSTSGKYVYLEMTDVHFFPNDNVKARYLKSYGGVKKLLQINFIAIFFVNRVEIIYFFLL